MAQQAFLLKVIGIPHIPSITEVNIRSGPGTNGDIVFKVPVGTNNVTIIDAKVDAEARNLEGKTYQWFRVLFPQGEGWIRDDLVEIWGDGTGVGYPALSQPVVAFSIQRSDALPQGAEIVGTTTVQGTSTTTSTPATAATEVVMSPTTPTPSTPATAATEVVMSPTTPATSTVTTTTTTTTTTTSTAAATPSGPAMAMCMGKTGVNVRPGPGSNYNPPLGRMNYRETAQILETKAGEDNAAFQWVKVNYQGKEGWVREDFLRFSGAFTAFGFNAPDKYASPAPNSWWVRGFDPTGQLYNTGPHHGWDHGGDKGAALLAGPQGGIVFDSVMCQRCGTEGASTLERGFSLGDDRIFRDQGWNFGYGHYIIVGYENSKLPESTKQYLANNGKSGWHLFVMYAHLQDRLVQKGATVSANQQIATLGNSGNSSGAHLHLEVRASQTMNITGWASINGGLMTPGVLYNF